MYKITANESIKILMQLKQMTRKRLGELMGETQANVSVRLNRDWLSSDKMVEYANLCNCDVKISYIDKNTNALVFESFIK